MTEEERVRRRIRESFESAIEDCIGAIYSYLSEFDELHTLVDSRRLSERVYKICESQARETSRIIIDYLSTLCLQYPYLIDDPQYPILQTLLDNHSRIANQIIVKTQQGKSQDKGDTDIIDYLRDYMVRAFKHSSDAVLFYESTRITVDVTLADAPNGAYFRTICEHDDKTCRICLNIEAEQARNPVPVSSKLTGINAPPFHPFCRCHVEVFE